MLKAIFIDLDNTLALFDELVFLDRFFQLLYKRFDDHFTYDDFQNRVVMATLSLGRSNGEKSNRDCFLDTVSVDYEMDQEEFWQRSMLFYENDFDQARPVVKKPKKLHTVLEQLKAMGLKLVLASNPVYPCIAMEKRLGWVDIDPSIFDLITHIENMNFVKPTTKYYRQICTKLDEAPANCLMVGNDPKNDIAAAGIKMKTYLTTDGGTTDYSSLSLKDDPEVRGSESVKADFNGPLAGVLGAVHKL